MTQHEKSDLHCKTACHRLGRLDTQRVFAGSRLLNIYDAAAEVPFPAIVLYPTETPAVLTSFGPYRMEVSPEAAVADGRFPLAIISHGSGSSHLLFRELGCHLAQHGYIVAAVQHPGNNRDDNRLENTVVNLVNRPKHLRAAVDALYAHPELGPHIQRDVVTAIGHSLGGYTALAAAGGVPTLDGHPAPTVCEPRLRALVLLAPATPWFSAADSLRSVTIPILMLIGEKDGITPRWHADLVIRGVADPSQVTCRIIPNAGHFSFLSPFPESMRQPNFRPATDPAGFDRIQFHRELAPEIRAFLDERLRSPRSNDESVDDRLRGSVATRAASAGAPSPLA